jgi:hypothetical protein
VNCMIDNARLIIISFQICAARNCLDFQLKDCPAIGPHWDNIGFQGIDPCTDVNRSMKMLAVLQVSLLAFQFYKILEQWLRRLYILFQASPSLQ